MLKCCHERVDGSLQGPIVAVSFRGDYALGSQGNDQAAAMRDYLAAVVAETTPAAVLLDLTGLQYSWGDAIGTLASPLRIAPGVFRPFCIVAAEPTAAALVPLLGPNFLLGLAGGRLFASRQEGLAYLASRLEEGRA